MAYAPPRAEDRPPGDVTVENASVAGMPDGSSEFIEVTSTGALEYTALGANGTWLSASWGALYGSGAYTRYSDVSIAGMPNGTTQAITIAES